MREPTSHSYEYMFNGGRCPSRIASWGIEPCGDKVARHSAIGPHQLCAFAPSSEPR